MMASFKTFFWAAAEPEEPEEAWQECDDMR